MELIIAAVARRHAQILQALGDLQLPQLAAHHPLERPEERYLPTLSQCFGVGASERPDHDPTIVPSRRMGPVAHASSIPATVAAIVASSSLA